MSWLGTSRTECGKQKRRRHLPHLLPKRHHFQMVKLEFVVLRLSVAQSHLQLATTFSTMCRFSAPPCTPPAPSSKWTHMVMGHGIQPHTLFLPSQGVGSPCEDTACGVACAAILPSVSVAVTARKWHTVSQAPDCQGQFFVLPRPWPPALTSAVSTRRSLGTLGSMS